MAWITLSPENEKDLVARIQTTSTHLTLILQPAMVERLGVKDKETIILDFEESSQPRVRLHLDPRNKGFAFQTKNATKILKLKQMLPTSDYRNVKCESEFDGKYLIISLPGDFALKKAVPSVPTTNVTALPPGGRKAS